MKHVIEKFGGAAHQYETKEETCTSRLVPGSVEPTGRRFYRCVRCGKDLLTPIGHGERTKCGHCQLGHTLYGNGFEIDGYVHD